jgi:ion channel-forming bestrophin family protein
MHLNEVTTAIRCLSRQLLVLVPAPSMGGLGGIHTVLSTDSFLSQNMGLSQSRPTEGLSKADELKTIETVKILIAMLYTVKNHLRAEWGVALSPGTSLTEDGQEANTEEYKDLLPPGMKGYEHRGLGLTLELATFVEAFVRDGVKK